MVSLDTIEGIRQEEYVETIVIYFTLLGNDYSLNVRKPHPDCPKHRALSIFHQSSTECPFCKKCAKHYYCSTLCDRLLDIFHYLISSNQLRLEWLYYEYE